MQNGYIGGLQTRVVIPLRSARSVPVPPRDLNPALQVDGAAVILDTAALGALPLSALKNPVANLRAQAGLITDALDALFGGY